jgi:O-antigen/teichoic acid export membrane protein
MRSIQYRVVFTFLNKIFLSGLGFLVSIITARYLNMYNRGLYTNATVYISVYAACLGGYGAFAPYAINRLKLPLRQVFQTSMWFYYFVSLLTLVVLVVGLGTGWIPHDFAHVWISFFLLAAPFLLGFGFYSRLLQGLDEIERLNRANTIQTVVFVVLSGFAWLALRQFQETTKLYLILVMWVVSQIASMAYSIVQIRKSANVTFWPKWHRNVGKSLLNFGSNIAVGNLIERVNLRADYFMVQYLCNPNDLAIYGIAVSASEVMNFVASSITNVIFKRIAASEEKESVRFTSKIFRITATGSVIAAILAVLAFHILIPILYGTRYRSAIEPFEILVFGVAFYGLWTILAMYFTNQLSRPRLPIYLDIVSILVNVSICFFLIPKVGIVGAAIGSAVSYMVECLLAIFLFRMYTKASVLDLLWMNREDWNMMFGMVRRRMAG